MSLLLAFEAAARHQSFTRAAEELALTQSGVSRQVQALEEMLGVELFQRVGRRIVLTEVGAMYVRELGGALGRIRDATLQTLAYRSGGGSVHLAVLPTFGSKWLMPRLQTFYAKHPGVLVHIRSRIGEFDLNLAGVDAAIGNSRDGHWPGVTAYRLLEEELVPVVSPERARAQPIRTPADMLMHQLLQVASRPHVWRDWFSAQGCPASSLQHGPTFELTSHLIQAVSAGLGVGLVPRFLVEDELASGTLVIASDATLWTGLGYYLFIPPHKAQFPPVAALREWLLGLDGVGAAGAA